MPVPVKASLAGKKIVLSASLKADGIITLVGAKEAKGLGVSRLEISVNRSSEGKFPSDAARASRKLSLRASLLLGKVPFFAARAVKAGAKNLHID